jgi:hypothetical protein
MISTPFHPTPHSPSGGSERGLLPSLNNGEETGKRISHDRAQLLEYAVLAVYRLTANKAYHLGVESE